MDKEKIVEFGDYCSKCKYKNLSEADDPCDACLSAPVNSNSRRPLMFESAKKFAKK